MSLYNNNDEENQTNRMESGARWNDDDQSPSSDAPFSVSRVMGEGVTSKPEDIKSTALAMNKLGYYDLPAGAGLYWMEDQGFRRGLRQFQQDQGLKVDGLIYELCGNLGDDGLTKAAYRGW